MAWQVRNNRPKRPVTDPASGIVLRGTVTLSDEQLAELRKNPVIAAMLRFDADGKPQGSELLTVTEVADKKGKPAAEGAPAGAPSADAKSDEAKPKKGKPAAEG